MLKVRVIASLGGWGIIMLRASDAQEVVALALAMAGFVVSVFPTRWFPYWIGPAVGLAIASGILLQYIPPYWAVILLLLGWLLSGALFLQGRRAVPAS